MLRFFCAALGALLLGVFSLPAAAYSDYCLEQAAQACGSVSVGECFNNPDAWDWIDDSCTGDVQSMIEDERDFYNSGGETDYGTNEPQPEPDFGTNYSTAGLSYGGNLRSGPGMEYSDVGSLAEGEPITILEASGVWWNDYQWYYISTPYGDAYQWGGILCASSVYEGIYGVCN